MTDSLLVRTEPLGGTPLGAAAIAGTAPGEWYPARPASNAEWRTRVEETRRGASADWLAALRPALAPSGTALERLERVARAGGVVVTTGQQPGLFGGPMYTWSKALSALALADAIEEATGVPCAPVFWAATDDTDYAEASWTVVALPGGATRLDMAGPRAEGVPMSAVPLGDVAEQYAAVERAARSAANRAPLRAARAAYDPGETVGGAYVRLLRTILEPLGVAVLDAAHAAVRRAASPVLRDALRRAPALADAVRARDAELRERGYEPQVAEVPGLSLVFSFADIGKRRIPIADAGPLAASAADGTLSANVLLRPVLERHLLPTVTYMAGPGEIAYFAQVGAVAAALDVPPPLAVPRWSCTVVEPEVARTLADLGLDADDLRDPHAAETRLARAAMPADVSESVDRLRAAARDGVESAAGAARRALPGLASSVPEGLARALAHRIDRFERRLLAAVKRREHETLLRVATARGALFPLGIRQERALNAIPLMARHGDRLIDLMLAGAREHASDLIASRPAAEEARAAAPRTPLGTAAPPSPSPRP